jgi:hypothetical protein
VIFLEIDGVLNTAYPRHETIGDLNPTLVDALVRILKASSAKVILSSSWRQFPILLQKLRAGLEERGLDPALIIGRTPFLDGNDWTMKRRTDEITAWLKKQRAGTHGRKRRGGRRERRTEREREREREEEEEMRTR